MSLVELATLRQAAYRLLAALLLPPDRQRLQRLRGTAIAFRPSEGLQATLGFFSSWQRLLRVLSGTKMATLAALQAEHTRVFSVNPEHTPCLPNESSYVTQALDAGHVTAQLKDVYARAGLRPSPALGESPDHASLELEFMAYLCQEEAKAWQGANAAQARRALEEERAFLHAHLGRWFGHFLAQVRAATTEPLYARAAEAGDAFIQHELDLVDALGAQVRLLSESSGRRRGAATRGAVARGAVGAMT